MTNTTPKSEETLQERLQREAVERWTYNSTGMTTVEFIKEITANAVAETIKAGVSVIEEKKMPTPDNPLAQYAEPEKMGFNAGIITAATALQGLVDNK